MPYTKRLVKELKEKGSANDMGMHGRSISAPPHRKLLEQLKLTTGNNRAVEHILILTSSQMASCSRL